MHITFHAGQRMNQRAIDREMIALVSEYGEPHDERTTLTKEAAARLVSELQRQAEKRQREASMLQRQLKVAKKVLDKGGLTVVSAESVTTGETVIITTYKCTSQKKGRKWGGKRNHSRRCNLTERAFKSQKRKYL